MVAAVLGGLTDLGFEAWVDGLPYNTGRRPCFRSAAEASNGDTHGSRFLLEGAVEVICSPPLEVFLGETSNPLGDRTIVALVHRTIPWGNHFWSWLWLERPVVGGACPRWFRRCDLRAAIWVRR